MGSGENVDGVTGGLEWNILRAHIVPAEERVMERITDCGKEEKNSIDNGDKQTTNLGYATNMEVNGLVWSVMCGLEGGWSRRDPEKGGLPGFQ